MPKNNAANNEFTPNADGFDITAGTAARTLTLTSGSVTMVGGSGVTYNFPTNSNYNKLVGMDGSNNAFIPNSVGHYTTTAASAGTLALTSSSTRYQFITGVTTHTITLPNATTLALGQMYHIRNDSTGSVTVQDATSPTPVVLFILPGGMDIDVTCTSISTAAGTWVFEVTGSQGIIPSEQYIINNANRTLTSQTGAQKIFGTPTNGALTVNPLSTYFFECVIYLTGMSPTTGNAGFNLIGAGSATVTTASYFVHGLDSTTQTTGLALGGSFVATTASTAVMVTTGTGTALHAFIKGTFKTNAGGTIIPSISQTTAAAAVVNPGTYFRCWKVGDAATNFAGAWT